MTKETLLVFMLIVIGISMAFFNYPSEQEKARRLASEPYISTTLKNLFKPTPEQ
jgi:hypothetical protein